MINVLYRFIDHLMTKQKFILNRIGFWAVSKMAILPQIGIKIQILRIGQVLLPP